VRLGLISFTARGNTLRESLADGLIKTNKTELIVWDKTQVSLKTFVARHFKSIDGFVFIGAIGIAVRVTAPYLESKAQDPAVVVLDEAGRYVIPVLSGHLGGANALAQDIAALMGAEPVITTSTDVHGTFAVDTWSRTQDCGIVEIDRIKHISGALLDGQPVGLASDFEISGKIPAGLTPAVSGSVGICVSFSETKQPFGVTLHVVPKRVTLGIGCRRGTAFEDLERFIFETLADNDISLKAVSALHSIDLKKEETCLLRFSETYGIPFKTFSAEALRSVPGDFERSAFVESITGVDNVCERSAMATDRGDQGVSDPELSLGSDPDLSLGSDPHLSLGTDTDGAIKLSRQLVIPKRQKAGMTLAAATEDWRCEF